MVFKAIRRFVGGLKRLLAGSKTGRTRRRSVALELHELEGRTLPTAMGILVPAYFYPTPGGSPWDQLTAAAGTVHIMAIMNPDSGPGSAADPNYTAAVNGLRAAGGQVIGYVDTDYTKVPLKTVEAEINEYRQWYHLDGIFLDEMTSDASAQHIQYYQQLDSYVHKAQPHWTVVGNPGTNVPKAYVTQHTADVLVLFEDGTGYDTYTPPSWQKSYPAQRFANLVYNVSTAGEMQTDVNLAAARHTGWVYMTDDTLPNPYDTLPSYWTELVTAVSEANVSAPSPGGADLGSEWWNAVAAPLR